MKLPKQHTPRPTTLRSFATVSVALWCVLQTGAADYPSTVLADNPVAYYRLEETSGDTAVDSSPSGFNATYTFNTAASSPQLGLPGIDTNSVSFTGGPDFGFVDIPFQPALSPTVPDSPRGAAFSVECWVRAATQPADYSVPLAMFGPYEASPPFANASGWNFYQSPGPNSIWVFNLKNGAFIQASQAPVTLLQWYHLAATYDGTNAIFYTNGIPVGGPIASPNYLAANGPNGQIGAGQNTGFLPFNGGVDEVAFYTNALTPERILAHYQTGTNSFRAPPSPPTILQDPVSTTNYSGTTVTFSALAGGTPTPQLQWYRGASPIPGATGNTYSFVCSYPVDEGAAFSVLATNLVGSTNSASATLTVLTNLDITYQPFSITRKQGSHAAFRTVATGALPLTYQWFKGGAEIAGATNDTLWLAEVPIGDDGSTYRARVTNPFTTADSTNATLNVVPRPSQPPATGYASFVLADDPVAYWRLDETNGSTVAVDIAGSFDGDYLFDIGVLTFQVPTGIPHETNPAISISQGAVVTIPYALELNPVTGPWSAEAWVTPATLDPGNFRTVFSSMWNSDFGGHLFGWNVYQHVAGVWTLNLYNGTASGSFTSDLVHNPIVTNSWYYMAITDDLTTIRFYVNSLLVVSVDREGFGFIANGINGDVSVAGAPTVLGQRSDNAFAPFDGSIDEVAFYNYALSPQQIQNHYLNTTALNFTSAGGTLVLTWPAGTLVAADKVDGTYSPVPGATSPYTNTPSGTEKYFQVQVQ